MATQKFKYALGKIEELKEGISNLNYIDINEAIEFHYADKDISGDIIYTPKFIGVYQNSLRDTKELKDYINFVKEFSGEESLGIFKNLDISSESLSSEKTVFLNESLKIFDRLVSDFLKTYHGFVDDSDSSLVSVGYNQKDISSKLVGELYLGKNATRRINVFSLDNVPDFSSKDIHISSKFAIDFNVMSNKKNNKEEVKNLFEVRKLILEENLKKFGLTRFEYLLLKGTEMVVKKNKGDIDRIISPYSSFGGLLGF